MDLNKIGRRRSMIKDGPERPRLCESHGPAVRRSEAVWLYVLLRMYVDGVDACTYDQSALYGFVYCTHAKPNSFDTHTANKNRIRPTGYFTLNNHCLLLAAGDNFIAT